MKSHRTFACVLMAAIALMFVVGCAPTAKERMAQALDSFTAAANTTTALVDAGKIKDRDTLLAIEAVSAEMSAALKQAKAQFEAGNDMDANFWVTMAENATTRLLEYLAKVQRKQ